MALGRTEGKSLKIIVSLGSRGDCGGLGVGVGLRGKLQWDMLRGGVWGVLGSGNFFCGKSGFEYGKFVFGELRV